MEKKNVRIEIYEDDPFGGACCGPGTRISSMAEVEKLRRMLTERDETVKKLSKEYQNIVSIQRTIINRKRWDYPEYVRKLMSESRPLPYIFINEELILAGKFPSYDEFVALLEDKSHKG